METGTQTQQINALGLDQLSDIVNRAGVADKRRRNEMIRLGASDPTSFNTLYANQIQQAEQPTEFLGAGRKEYDPATADTGLIGALGGTTQQTKAGQNFYYGDFDLSKGRWGTQDTDDIDLGGGKYTMMENGQNIGTGYKSLQDTIRDYVKPVSTTRQVINPAYIEGGWDNRAEVYTPPTTGIDQYLSEAGYTLSGKDFYNDQELAQAAIPQFLQGKLTGNTLRDWETLGQLLNTGMITGDFSTPHAIGGSNADELIKGLDTLYGSRPVIYDGKLIGYNQQGDLEPIQDQWNNQSVWSTGGGFLGRNKTYHSYDVGALAEGRQYQDQDWWAQNARMNPNGTFNMTEDVAKDSPGWANVDRFQRVAGLDVNKSGYLSGLNDFMGEFNKITDPLLYETLGGKDWYDSLTDQGIYSTVFDRLDPVLDDLDPGHDPTQNAIRDTLGVDTQKQAFNTIAPLVVSWFAPYGALLNAGNSAQQGDFGGAAASLLGQAIASGVGNTTYAPVQEGSTAATGGATSGGGIFNSGIDLGKSSYNVAAQNMILSAAKNYAANGGDLKSAVLGAMAGGAGGMAGDTIAKATQGALGDFGSKMLGGAASGGLSSLFSGNNAVNGSLFGAMSGGLHGFLNSVDRNADTFNTDSNQQNKQTATNITKLAKLFARK